MTNLEKYDNAFIDCFGLDSKDLNTELSYMSIPDWDSVGHMTLIALLEDVFGIMIETDDIIEFSSYEKGKEILGKYITGELK